VAAQVGRLLAARGAADQNLSAAGRAEPGADGAAGRLGGRPLPGDAPGTPQTSTRPNPQGRSEVNRPQEPAGERPERADSSSRGDFDRLVRSLRLRVGSHESTARLRLDPPELGWIRIQARVGSGRIELLVQTQRSGTAELIKARADRLQASLEQHGLSIERFEVTAVAASEPHSPAGGRAFPDGGSNGDPGRSPPQDNTAAYSGGQGESGSSGDESGANNYEPAGALPSDCAVPLSESVAPGRLDLRG